MNTLIKTFVFLVLISLFACSPARKIIRKPLREQGPEFVFSKLKNSELQFDWLQFKFSADISIDKKWNSISGQIRIKRDSIIWVSLTPALGLEAIRILITPDTVKYLNRLESTYLVTDFSFINDNLNSGFDFDLLQALVIGNDVKYYENDKFKASLDNGRYELSTIARRKIKRFVKSSNDNLKVLIQNIWIDPENGKILEINTKELGKESRKLNAKYSDFSQVKEQWFPTHVDYNISAEKDIHIRIDYSKMKINEPLNFPFSIPEKYSRIIKKAN